MSIFNRPDLYGSDGQLDDHFDGGSDAGGEDDDVLNDETFGAAEVVDWETEHNRLAGLDVNGFEEFSLNNIDDTQTNGKPNLNEANNFVTFSEPTDRNFNPPDNDYGVDVEMDLQRLVLEVDRDDRIESAWLSADPAIKLLSKKIPSKVTGTESTAPGHGLTPAGDMADTVTTSGLLSGMDDHMEKIWGPSPTAPVPPRSTGLAASSLGVKTVAELEDELAVEAEHALRQRQQQARLQLLQQQQQQQQVLSQQPARPSPKLDGSLSPTVPLLPPHMLLNPQNYPPAAQLQHIQQLSQLIQQQQLQQQLLQQQQPSTRPVLPSAFHHPMYRAPGMLNPAAGNSTTLAQSVSQLLMPPAPPPPAPAFPANANQLVLLYRNLEQLLHQTLPPIPGQTLQQQQQLQQQRLQQIALVRSQLETVSEQIQQQQMQQHSNAQQHQSSLQQQQHGHQSQQQHSYQHENRRWHNAHDNSGGDNNSGYNRQRRYSEHIGPDRFGNSDDPYAGLMTRSEKEWLINIHHRQLEVDNPFKQDYYYTQYHLKRDLAARNAAIGAGELPLPPDPLLFLRAPVEVPDEFDDSMNTHTSAPYEPSQFANTLGKLTTASVHNPRQVIDARVHRDSTEPDEAGVGGAGDGEGSRSVSISGNSSSVTGLGAANLAANQERHRRILLTIENCYNLMLKIDEYDLSIAKILVPNAPSRHVLIADRHRLRQQLLDIILASEKSLVEIFRVRKGAMVFARMLNKLEMKYIDLCLRSLFKCFPRIRQSPRSLEVLDEVGSDFLKIVSASLRNQEGPMLQSLLFFIWMETKHAEILSHRLGLSLILEILSRCAASVTDPDELKHLQMHVEQLTMNLLVLSSDRHVRPYCSYSKLLEFMRRHMPEVMLNNFSDRLVNCMTTEEEAQQQVQQQEQEMQPTPPPNPPAPAVADVAPVLASHGPSSLDMMLAPPPSA